MTEHDRKSSLSPFRLVGFNIFYTRSIRDDDTQDVILFDAIGPLQAIRGIWAALKQKKHNCYQLGGMCKLHKEPGHYVMKETLPSGYVNWTWISRQAIPKLINTNLPTFVWYEPEDIDPAQSQWDREKIPPKNFMPIFQAAAPFPIRPEWANELWTIGRKIRCIRKVDYRNVTNVSAWKIIMNRDRWELKITEGIKDGSLGLKLETNNHNN